MKVLAETLGGTSIEVDVLAAAKSIIAACKREGIVISSSQKSQGKVWEQINTYFAWAVICNHDADTIGRATLNQIVLDQINSQLDIKAEQ